MPKVLIAGVGFDAVSQEQALQRIEDFLVGKAVRSAQTAWGSQRPPKKFLIVTPNPEMVMAAQTDLVFRKVLNSAQLAIADGIGIIWASYYLSLPRRGFFILLGSLLSVLFRRPKIYKVLPERVTGTDLLPELLNLVAERKQKVFLLGAATGVAEKVQTRFQKEIPELAIVGTYAGSPAESEEESIRQKIDASGATVLCVAYGAPAQELWLARQLPLFKHIKLAVGVGGAFDFRAGLISRAPLVFRSLGLEWLWRLVLQPSRAGRIWTATWRFVRLIRKS